MRVFLAGVLLVLAFAAAGCGGGGSSSNGSPNGEAAKSAEQVLADAVKAAEAASSTHMSGEVNTPAQQIGLDMTIVKGKGATGSITLKGKKVELVVIGADAYMKAGADFWTQFGGSRGPMIAQLVSDKWLKFPTGNAQFGQLTSFTNSNSIFESMSSGHGKLVNKGLTTYEGQSAVAINDSSEDGTLYVAATGTAYPIAVSGIGGSSSGAIKFDKWNESVTLTAPDGALDFSQFIH